jgi:hypothetical protein
VLKVLGTFNELRKTVVDPSKAKREKTVSNFFIYLSRRKFVLSKGLHIGRWVNSIAYTNQHMHPLNLPTMIEREPSNFCC